MRNDLYIVGKGYWSPQGSRRLDDKKIVDGRRDLVRKDRRGTPLGAVGEDLLSQVQEKGSNRHLMRRGMFGKLSQRRSYIRHGGF